MRPLRLWLCKTYAVLRQILSVHGVCFQSLEPEQQTLDEKEFSMRVLVLVKADDTTEAGQLPSTEMLTEMNEFNEQLVNAGVMQMGEGLHPSSKGKRVRW